MPAWSMTARHFAMSLASSCTSSAGVLDAWMPPSSGDPLAEIPQGHDGRASPLPFLQ
jgi:hypothetical protein